MPCRLAHLRSLPWLLLAAWMAMWPGLESRQSAVRQALRTVTPARELALAGGGCCRARAVEAPSGPIGGDRHGCCRPRDEATTRPASCPEGGGARCGQCFGTAGLLMLAYVQSLPDPERPVLGALRPGDHVASSRDLRPPVPPPRPASAPILA